MVTSVLATQQAAAALTAVGASVSTEPRDDATADLEIEVGEDRLLIEVKSAGRLQRAGAAFGRREGKTPTSTHGRSAQVVLVVADRIDPAARRELRDAGIGSLDLAARHLTLRAPGLIIDTEVDLGEDVAPPVDRGLRSPFTDVGLKVAFRALRDHLVPVRVRATASRLEVSPTQVSTVCRALIGEGLLDEHRKVVHPPDLFWALAEHWRTPPAVRTSRPRAELAGAVSVGDEAALHWGAPVVATPGEPLLYLPAKRYLPPPAPGEPAARVTVAPVPEAAEAAVDDPAHGLIAGPLAIALMLAQDRGRGREILSEWEPPPHSDQARVW